MTQRQALGDFQLFQGPFACEFQPPAAFNSIASCLYGRALGRGQRRRATIASPLRTGTTETGRQADGQPLKGTERCGPSCDQCPDSTVYLGAGLSSSHRLQTAPEPHLPSQYSLESMSTTNPHALEARRSTRSTSRTAAFFLERGWQDACTVLPRYAKQ